MKKTLSLIALVLLLAAGCNSAAKNKQSPPQSSNRVEAEFGQDFTLKKDQVAYFKDTDATLKILDFYNQPCPQGSQCFWSGQDVYWQLDVGGKSYKKDKTGTAVGDFPYAVSVKDSDYSTYAKFNVQTNQSSMPQGSKTGWNSYTSPAKYGFSIQYPDDFGFNTDYSKIQSLGYIPVCNDSMAACVFYTGDKYKGTNFESAGISINILKDLTTENKCYNFKVSTNEAQQDAGIVAINGVDFRSATGGQGAAGHFMKTQAYRNFHNNQCYEIAQRVGSTNIGNYEPGTIKEYNQNEVWNNLKQIVSTFKFVDAAKPISGNQVTVTGTIVCLPHKNVQPGQPQTMECAIGLKEQGTGKYYSLKNNQSPIYDTNVPVKATGALVDDSQSNYDVVGAIEVSKITRIDK